MSRIDGPTYPPERAKALAADPDTFAMDAWALQDALGFGLDDEDVRDVFARIEEWTFLRAAPTRKHHPNTVSDSYCYFVEECMTRMYIKFVVDHGVLTVTSFKEDDQYDY